MIIKINRKWSIHFKKNKLAEILGKAIVEEYKKDNPHDQSMRASDVSRLTFIVKSVAGKTKSKNLNGFLIKMEFILVN